MVAMLDFVRHDHCMSANHRFESLLDLAHRDKGLEVRCLCGRLAVLEANALWRRFVRRGWDTRLHMVGDRLRCTGCGARRPSVRVAQARY